MCLKRYGGVTVIPTNKLRWLVRKNQVTSEEVTAYRDTKNVSMAEAKAALVNEKKPVLQQWFSSGEQNEAGHWQDIEVVVESSPI